MDVTNIFTFEMIIVPVTSVTGRTENNNYSI